MQPAGSTQGNGRAQVNVELDLNPVGSARYNMRVLIDLRSVRVEPAGSTQCNALAREYEMRRLVPVEAAFCWRENRLAKVTFEQEI